MRQLSLKRALRRSVLALGLASTAVIAAAPNTFAATQTWTGTDCATDCNFSNTLNWQSGVVPVNGDTVIVNSSFPSPINDIANLSLASLSLNDNDIRLDANLVLTGTLVSASGTNTISATASGNLLLGGNVTMSSTGGSLTLDTITSGELQLASNTLTISGFNYPGEFTGFMPITGSGTVNYNSGNVFVGANNTYSGTTNISADGSPMVVVSSTNPFGSSVINVADYGALVFAGGHSNLAVANVINLAARSTDASPALTFGSSSQTGSYALSGVVMNSNVVMSNFGSSPTVDLAGITTNGYCVTYQSGAESFSNGPELCPEEVVQIGGSAAEAPNTALRMLTTANPAVVAVLGLLSVVALAFVARKVAAQK